MHLVTIISPYPITCGETASKQLPAIANKGVHTNIARHPCMKGRAMQRDEAGGQEGTYARRSAARALALSRWCNKRPRWCSIAKGFASVRLSSLLIVATCTQQYLLSVFTDISLLIDLFDVALQTFGSMQRESCMAKGL